MTFESGFGAARLKSELEELYEIGRIITSSSSVRGLHN